MVKTNKKIESGVTRPFYYLLTFKKPKRKYVYAFKYRMEDARINRFFSPDPLHGKYPYNSDYAFSENRLIDGVEFEGLEFASFTLNNNLTNFFYKGQAWLDKAHAEGIGNYEVGKAAQQQAISQGRSNGDGITNTTLALVYLAPFWNSVAPLSDANDGAVLIKGQNLDGSSASKIDYTLAVLGAGIPFFSGSSLKEIFRVSSKELTVAKYNYKHVAPNIPWNKVIEATKNGPAKFKKEINVEKITREAWDNGTAVSNGKTWKVYEAVMYQSCWWQELQV